MVKEIRVRAFICDLGDKRCGTFYSRPEAESHEQKHRHLSETVERANIREVLSQLSLAPFSFYPESADWNHEIEDHGLPPSIGKYFSEMRFSSIDVCVTKQEDWFVFQFGPLLADLIPGDDFPYWKVVLHGSKISGLKKYINSIHEDSGEESIKARINLLRSLARIAFQRQMDLEEKEIKIPPSLSVTEKLD